MSHVARQLGLAAGAVAVAAQSYDYENNDLVCNKETLEKLISIGVKVPRKLDPRIFKLYPAGARMLIVKDLPVEEYGDSGIVIPPIVAEKDPPATGWVLSVGPMAGIGQAAHPYGLQVHNPADLLYRRVMFGIHVGRTVRTDFKSNLYETEFWLLTDRDIWVVDYNIVTSKSL